MDVSGRLLCRYQTKAEAGSISDGIQKKNSNTSQDLHDDQSDRYTGRPNDACGFDTSL